MSSGDNSDMGLDLMANAVSYNIKASNTFCAVSQLVHVAMTWDKDSFFVSMTKYLFKCMKSILYLVVIFISSILVRSRIFRFLCRRSESHY